ncbi:helix-turn-helix transcriptional regulator [Lactococcus sp. S64]|nr:helix-turn-helix transcriptional regulator [Lactococcus sp. S64]
MLLFADRSFKDIANSLNFSSQSHFISQFKKQEGMTPLEFRKKYSSTALY